MTPRAVAANHADELVAALTRGDSDTDWRHVYVLAHRVLSIAADVLAGDDDDEPARRVGALPPPRLPRRPTP